MYFPKEGILIPKAVMNRRAGGIAISQYRVFLREGGHDRDDVQGKDDVHSCAPVAQGPEYL